MNGTGKLSAWLQFLGMGFVWGSSFFFMKIALDGVSFGQVAWSRAVLGALALGIIVAVTRPRVKGADGSLGPVLPRRPIVWAHFAVVGIVGGAIPYLLFAWAEQYVTSSLASIYNATTPITTALMVTLVFQVEKLGVSRWLGIAVGVAGVVVIIAPWQYEALTGSIYGQLACLGATVCYGFMFAYVRKFVSGLPIAPATFAFMNIGMAAAFMIVMTPVIAWTPVRLDPVIVGALLILGAFGTGLAYIWQINVIRAWGPTNTSTVTYVTPVVGVLMGVLLLHERFSWHEPLGAVIVFVGILMTQGRFRMRAPFAGR